MFKLKTWLTPIIFLSLSCLVQVCAYAIADVATWSTGTYSSTGYWANINAPNPNHSNPYSDPPQSSFNDPTLKPGDVLYRGWWVTSSNGRYQFALDSDGALRVYHLSSFNGARDYPALWFAGYPEYIQDRGWYKLNPVYGDRFVMKQDGNLVLYSGNSVVWETKTNNYGYNCWFIVQDDGNAVFYYRYLDWKIVSPPDGKP